MATTKKKDPEGYTCKCGKFHQYSAWAYAHADEEITHTCPKCKRKASIVNLIATPITTR